MKNKEISFLIIISFIGYVFLANYWYLERVVMPDTSFQLFQILRTEDFAIQIQRFGAAMTQVFPLLASRLDLSLDSVVRIYAMSFPICYLLLVAIILGVYRNLKLGIVYFFFHFLINTHSFFWAQCELIQAVSLFLVWMAYLEYHLKNRRFGWLFWMINLSFIITLVFFYPLIIILVVFSFLFLYHQELKAIDREIVGSIGLYIVLFILKLIFFKNYYDSGSMSGLKNFVDLFPNYLIQRSFQNFWNYIIHDYYFLILGFIFPLIYYIQKRYWYRFVLFISFFIGIILLVNVCFFYGADQFYLEGQYAMICVIVGLVWVYELMPIDQHRSKWMIALIVIFGLFVSRIESASSFYSQRVDFYNQLIEKYPTEKVVLKETPEMKSKLKMTWGSPYEVWLLSTMRLGYTNSILIHPNPSQYIENLPRNKSLFTCFELIDYEEMNSKYVEFKDTNQYIIYDSNDQH